MSFTAFLKACSLSEVGARPRPHVEVECKAFPDQFGIMGIPGTWIARLELYFFLTFSFFYILKQAPISSSLLGECTCNTVLL